MKNDIKKWIRVVLEESSKEQKQIARVMTNPDYIVKIENPSDKVIKAAIIANPDILCDYNKKINPDILNQCKNNIIKYILQSVKIGADQAYYTPRVIIHKLRKSGCNWPELDTITNSIEHDLKKDGLT